MLRALTAPACLVLSLLAAGCDQLGIESASAVAARREADGKAVGGACRHAGRAIEDCYVLNRRADRAAVYAGWREMNEYMLENKLEAVAPQIQTETQVASTKPADSEAPDDTARTGDKAEKTGAKADEKPADKPADAPPRRRRPAP
jgi:hypothetical protein